MQNVKMSEVKSYVDSITKYKQCSETLYRGLENIASGKEVPTKANNHSEMEQFKNIQKIFREIRKDCESLKKHSSSRQVVHNFLKVAEQINIALRKILEKNVLLLTFFATNLRYVRPASGSNQVGHAQNRQGEMKDTVSNQHKGAHFGTNGPATTDNGHHPNKDYEKLHKKYEENVQSLELQYQMQYQRDITKVKNENDMLKRNVRDLQFQLTSIQDARTKQHGLTQNQQMKQLEDMHQQMSKLVVENEKLVDKNKFLEERVGDLTQRYLFGLPVTPHHLDQRCNAIEFIKKDSIPE